METSKYAYDNEEFKRDPAEDIAAENTNSNEENWEKSEQEEEKQYRPTDFMVKDHPE